MSCGYHGSLVGSTEVKNMIVHLFVCCGINCYVSVSELVVT